MGFKVVIHIDGRIVDMPHDHNLRLSEACYRADIYKKRNEGRTFSVVSESTGDIEYQV